MASLRFSYTNLLEVAGLKNGTGSGAPALDEVSPWLTSYAQDRDRGHFWQAAASVAVDFDLTQAASNTSVGFLAALGHRGAPSSAVGIASIVTKYSTHANGYPPSAASSWTNFTGGTITLGSGVRDGGAIIAAPVSCRYVRFDITATSAFTLGRLFAGTVELDLGIVSSPGYSRRRILPRSESRMGGGSPFLTQNGDPRWEYSLPYEDVGATLFAKLLTVGSLARSFVLIDRDSAVLEAIVAGGEFSHSLLFDVPDMHRSSLSLETLG